VPTDHENELPRDRRPDERDGDRGRRPGRDRDFDDQWAGAGEPNSDARWAGAGEPDPSDRWAGTGEPDPSDRWAGTDEPNAGARWAGTGEPNASARWAGAGERNPDARGGASGSGRDADADRRRRLDERARHDDLVRERRPPAHGDRPDPPSTAERFYPQARPDSLAREELGVADDGWYTAETVAAGDPERAAPRSEDSLKGADRPAATSKGADGGTTQGKGPPKAQEGSEESSGPELARAVLDAALAKRRENQARRPRRAGGSGEGRRLRGYSGPGPDPRDPQLFGDMLQKLMKARGWERPKAEATVFAAWEKVVGAEIAQHSRPVKLDAGVLTVEAESTAWATQLRLLAATLLRNIAGEVGHNVVTKLNIHGPAAPSWAKGPRRVQGRGPRDTYG
jgi:predicted nucleic acid-binding Zn ribbon protein